jgi:hypothetical protein
VCVPQDNGGRGVRTDLGGYREVLVRDCGSVESASAPDSVTPDGMRGLVCHLVGLSCLVPESLECGDEFDGAVADAGLVFGVKRL